MEAPPVVNVPVVCPPRCRPLWKRLLAWFLWLAGGGLLLIVALAALLWWSWNTGRLTRWMLGAAAQKTSREAPLEAPWPPPGTPPGTQPPDRWTGPRLDAHEVTSAAGFYRTTNLWEVHLHLTAAQWDALQVGYIRPGMNFLAPGEKFPLRNPKAPRNGLAGVIGLTQPWSGGELEVGGVRFAEVGIRIKGNGTLLGSLGSFKKPYKVDLNRGVPDQNLSGITTLNLGNLAADYSGMSDALAYEFFRAAGVPSPRTAFARGLLSIDGQFGKRPLGLYVLVENPDRHWAKEIFPGRKISLFKPVTYELFSDLGTNWQAYAGVYDPKTAVGTPERTRVMETARFVTGASDEEFARRYGEFFDVDEVVRFIGAHALISSYDGFLNNGQNFLMYLDGETGRFGFIPWDQDQAWGEFQYVGRLTELEQASVLRPWIADNRLLERLFAVPEFQARYRKEVGRLADTLFQPERWAARIDQLAAVIRPVVEEESDYRRRRFPEAITDEWSKEPRDGDLGDPNRPTHQVKRFLVKRAESVRDQLAGRSEGHVFRERKVPGPPPPPKK